MKLLNRNSGSVAVVIFEHPIESLVTSDLTSDSSDFFARLDQPIVESLVAVISYELCRQVG